MFPWLGFASPAATTNAAETIVVTASRTPVSAAAVGSSVSVIDRAEIEARQSVFAADLLNEVPGASVSRSGGVGSQTQLRLRGAEANQVLVLIDGVEAGDPAGNSEFSFEHLTTFDIERIEVVRGPQSALWGSDALAGVVNVITRRADEDFAADGFGEAGAFDTFYGGGRVGGKAGGVSMTLSASHLAAGGSNSSRTGDETDGYDNTTLSFTAGANPAPGLELALFGRYTDATKEFDTDFTTGLPGDSDSKSEISLGYFRASAALDLLDSRWSHAVRTTLTTTDTDSFEAGTPAGTVAADKYGIYYQTSFRFGETREANRAGALTLALDHEREAFSQRGAASPYGDPNQDQGMHNTGYIAEYLVEPVRPVSLSLSIRRDDNSDFADVTTWRTTAAWNVASTGTHSHASYGTGQKAPTFIERFGNFPDEFIGNPNLQPERSRGWEVGADQALAGDRLTVDATYFREQLEDEINGFAFDSAQGKYTATNLQGTSDRRGVEITLRSRLTTQLTLHGNYTYVDATQPDAAAGVTAREIRRPRHIADLGANYSFAAGRANLNLNVAYNGDRTDTFFEPAPPFGVETVRLGGYTLATLAGTYRFNRQVSVYGRVENLLNENYEDVLGYNTPGIGAYAGVRLSFGP